MQRARCKGAEMRVIFRSMQVIPVAGSVWLPPRPSFVCVGAHAETCRTTYVIAPSTLSLRSRVRHSCWRCIDARGRICLLSSLALAVVAVADLEAGRGRVGIVMVFEMAW
jgi:hypothetical protein